jgi:arsenate reductase
MKILFVCKGNHGRSQIAEAIFNNISGGKHIATSAGTKVTTEEKDRDGHKVSAPLIIEVMKELGIDVSEKIRNQLTPEMVEKADKIVVMAQPETIPEYLKQSKKAIYWEVPDPAGQPIEFAREVRDKLNSLIKNFIETSSELKIH